MSSVQLGFTAAFWESASPGLFPSEDQCWMSLHNSGLRADAAGFFLGIELLDEIQKFTSLCPTPCCCGSWWAASSASSVK